MIPKTIEVEHFLSFGAKQCIRFDDGEPLWVLSGSNGVGKSAVFDAVTYALYGQHRGGKDGAKNLIRHQENGFHVSLHFEFAGTDYRVTRTRSHTGTTQRADVLQGGEWTRVPNVTTAKELEGWVETLLGVNFKGFTSSVLLRQGDADKVLTATGPDRLVILRSIIGAERFEQLGKRVREATKEAKGAYEHAVARRDEVEPVAPTEMEAADATSREAEKAWQLATEAANLAAAAVPVAKQWADLEARRGELEAYIAQADADQADAERVRTNYVRLRDLTAAVPRLRDFFQARAVLSAAEESLIRAKSDAQFSSDNAASLTTKVEELNRDVEAARAEVDHNERAEQSLRDESKKLNGHLAIAEAVAEDAEKLREFPAGLAEQLAAAVSRVGELDEAVKSAGQERSKFAALLEQARSRQLEFDSVEVGVKCSRCGNAVTAEHADRERADLAALVACHTAKHQSASEDERHAKSEFTTAKAIRDQLQAQAAARDKLRSGYQNALAMLQQFGVAGTPDELRASVAEKQAAAEEHARQRESAKVMLSTTTESWNRARAELSFATANASKATNALVLAEQAVAVGLAKREAAFQQLPATWTDRASTMLAEEWTALDRERADLENSGAEVRHERLKDATLLRTDKETQLTTVRTQLAEIPAESRVSQTEAKARAEAASAHVSAADRARTSARQTAAAVRQRAAEFDRRKAEVAAAEVAHRRLATLDRHLGKDGLQRDVVRDAEAEIVRLADDTARNLSGNDLSLELAPEQDGESALTLRARRASDPSGWPTPVEYLSGSQKFRVAIAVALGIGRFAGGQSRPLESVIIDEGFGSLDRDGLAAAQDELNRLKSCLKRIILVSHQEEFAGRFPVGYRLTPGEHGTTATAFRV